LYEKIIKFVQRVYDAATAKRLIEWQDLIKSNMNKQEIEKLKAVNDFFNHIPNVSDMDNWGVKDYWATPLEFIAKNGGDCEDFAIAKYFTLRKLNVTGSKLSLTYVRAYSTMKKLTIIPHLVLTYYPGPDVDPLVLDNLMADILPASRRTDLIPTYSFDGDSLWNSKERNRGRLIIGGAKNVYPWQDLLQRMEEDSFWQRIAN
jgi:predicted transglutaminase-like cysteine proteinase